MINEMIDFLKYTWGRGKVALLIYTALMIIMLTIAVLHCCLPIWIAILLYLSPAILGPIFAWVLIKQDLL